MDDFKNGTAYNLDSFIFYKKKQKTLDVMSKARVHVKIACL